MHTNNQAHRADNVGQSQRRHRTSQETSKSSQIFKRNSPTQLKHTKCLRFKAHSRAWIRYAATF